MGTMNLVMDMADQPIDPRVPMPNQLLDQPASMWLMRQLSRLQVLCPYTSRGQPNSAADHAIVTMQISATYQLYPPGTPNAPGPGQSDTILAINRLGLRTFQPPNTELDFASLVAKRVVWAIRRPHIVQPNVSMTPTPYLPVIDAKGLYDLGVLFAVQVEKATTLKESWHHNPLRFGTTKHQTAVEQQRFAEQEDDDDEDEQDEDE